MKYQVKQKLFTWSFWGNGDFVNCFSMQVGDFDSRQRLQLCDGTDADHLLEVVWSPNLETSFIFQIYEW